MQSWGASSRFKKLATEREPTKSGLIGLLAAALGRERGEDIKDLCALRFGVRIDQPGRILRDYHTARHPNDVKRAFISERYYLSDAVFVAGLESEDEAFLRGISAALMSPRFPLYLGRRSCPPTGQIVLGISELCLEDALKSQEWQAHEWYMKRKRSEPIVNLEVVLDVPFESTGSFIRKDIPLSFNEKHRRYGLRSLASDIKGASVDNPRASEAYQRILEESQTKYKTEHDPYLDLGG